MLKTLKNHWCSSVFGHAAALGGVLEASWSVLERLGAVFELSWRRLGAVLELLLLSMLLLMLLLLFRSALGSILSCFEALLDRSQAFKFRSSLKFLAP